MPVFILLCAEHSQQQKHKQNQWVDRLMTACSSKSHPSVSWEAWRPPSSTPPHLQPNWQTRRGRLDVGSTQFYFCLSSYRDMQANLVQQPAGPYVGPFHQTPTDDLVVSIRWTSITQSARKQCSHHFEAKFWSLRVILVWWMKRICNNRISSRQCVDSPFNVMFSHYN